MPETQSTSGAAEPPARPSLSLVVPVFNEEENIAPLVRAVQAALGEGGDWELLLIDDGSRDGTARAAAEVAAEDGRIRLLRLARNYGQTAAMQAGFDHSRGEVVVSLDGDLQNDPRDIPQLIAKLDEGYDLVTGYRVRRQDHLLRRKVPSWVANRLIAWLTGVRIRDNGCSLKAYRRSLLDRLHLYSDMHRFLPSVAAATAGARVAEVPVRHHPRLRGTSKYGLSRIGKLLADLLTIKMITSFRDRPLRMFATAALVAAGFSALAVMLSVVSLRSFHIALTDFYVLPTVALLWAMLSIFLFLLGLVSEVVLRATPRAFSTGHRRAWR